MPDPYDAPDRPFDAASAAASTEASALEEVQRLRAQVAALENEVKSGREAEEILRGMFAAVPAFVIQYGQDLLIKSISRLQPGFDRDQVIGTHMREYVPADQMPHALAAIERAWATWQPQRYEVHGAGPNGERAYYETYVAPLRERDGSLAVMLVAIDVTVQRAQTEAFQRSESMLQLAMESTGIGLWVQDLTTSTVTWNDNAYRIFGCERPLNAHEYMNTLVHPEDRTVLQQESSTPPRAGRFHTPTHRIVRPDGSIRWVSTIRQVLCDDHGHPTNMIGGTQDVTEQYELELHNRHAQRMEAVGQLTAGIAHNFNNMLAAIVPALDLITPALPPNLSAFGEGAREAAARASAMVRQLMKFAGKRTVPARITRVSEVVQRALDLCQPLFERSIELRVNECDDVNVFIGPADLEQALVNVLLNARDAVLASPRSEKVVAITISRFDGHGDVQRPCPNDGVYAKLDINDTGTGMAKDVLARVFEPFFTTKDVGSGTGLGLAMVYAVATQAGGCVVCESEPGRGTSVVLYLPEATAPSSTLPDMAVTSPAAPLHRVVLIVEDEDTVATATLAVLRFSGVEAYRADSLVEALELARNHPEAHLVLLDRSMPGGPADKIVGDLRKLLPKACIAFFTGQDLTPEQAAVVDAVLLKPMSARDLLAFVASVATQA